MLFRSLGGLVGRLGTVLEAPWAILESRKAGKSYMLKMFIFPSEFYDSGLSGLSCEASGGSLGSSSRPLGPS